MVLQYFLDGLSIIIYLELIIMSWVFNLKVMADVTGAEFEVLVGVLSKLTYVSTPEGSQELSSLISGQAELASEFTVCIYMLLYYFEG